MQSRPYESLTHVHLRNVLATRLVDRGQTLRVLDFGSGSAVLTTYLQRELPTLGLSVEMYGLDVSDRQVQQRQFHEQSVARARSSVPGYPWGERLVLTASDEPWPFPEGFFDAVVSNQVFEHVHEPSRALSELARTLKPTGYSSHLFPFRSYVTEGHLHVPLAHRFKDSTVRENWIKRYYGLQARLGKGKYFRDGVEAGWSLDDYSDAHADYLVTETHYESFTSFARIASLQGLRVELDHTIDFYQLKLRQMAGRQLPNSYRNTTSSTTSIAGHLLKLVGGVAVGIQHADRYAKWRDRPKPVSEFENSEIPRDTPGLREPA